MKLKHLWLLFGGLEILFKATEKDVFARKAHVNIIQSYPKKAQKKRLKFVNGPDSENQKGQDFIKLRNTITIR